MTDKLTMLPPTIIPISCDIMLEKACWSGPVGGACGVLLLFSVPGCEGLVGAGEVVPSGAALVLSVVAVGAVEEGEVVATCGSNECVENVVLVESARGGFAPDIPVMLEKDKKIVQC